jgi:hypothetical protein
MNTFTHKSFSIAGLLAAGLFSAFSVYAADESTSTAKEDASPTCHQESRRVAVSPPSNPKFQQIPRFETRTLTVCDHGKVLSKPERTASASTFGPRYR